MSVEHWPVGLQDRRTASDTRRLEIARKIQERLVDSEFSSIAVFLAGSIARGEMGTRSDIDLFVISPEAGHAGDKDACFQELATALGLRVEELGSEKYRNIYPVRKLIDGTGTPSDDNENSFTTRMLLLLEGQAVFNEAHIADARGRILSHYFRDAAGHDDFRPLFLLNDILRYWRTLCLNYELKRNDPGQPWRKKNVNLKFARMMTVFGTILPIIAGPLEEELKIEKLCRLAPIERFECGLLMLKDRELLSGLPDILELYEEFLGWKEEAEIEEKLQDPNVKEGMRVKAERIADFFHEGLTHPKIKHQYRRLLVI